VSISGVTGLPSGALHVFYLVKIEGLQTVALSRHLSMCCELCAEHAFSRQCGHIPEFLDINSPSMSSVRVRSVGMNSAGRAQWTVRSHARTLLCWPTLKCSRINAGANCALGLGPSTPSSFNPLEGV
jgi:hypothetical protein